MKELAKKIRILIQFTQHLNACKVFCCALCLSMCSVAGSKYRIPHSSKIISTHRGSYLMGICRLNTPKSQPVFLLKHVELLTRLENGK